MGFITIRSSQISSDLMSSFVNSFNTAFELSYSKDYFLQKYQGISKLGAFHSFMIEDGCVVGACNVLPYNYIFENKACSIGLLTDVFILAEYRKNITALLNMIKSIETELIENSISALVAVPNGNSYAYLTKVVGMSEISEIPYYGLPLDIGAVIKKRSYLDYLNNPISIGYRVMWLASFFQNRHKSKRSRIYQNTDEPNFVNHRYYSYHERITTKKNTIFTYRIEDQDGINACYLIDYHDKYGNRNCAALHEVCSYLIRVPGIDIILFIGSISFPQTILLKIPAKYQPRSLKVVGKVLDERLESEIFFDASSWDFGLVNFDVR